jgi:hypothetical protein
MWILTNWKSNLSGLVGFALIGMLATKRITIEEFGTISGALVSLGLLIHSEK